MNALAAALRSHGGPLSEALIEDEHEPEPILAPPAPGPPQIASRGPRAAGREAEYELLLEMILEGSRLHYGVPRAVRTDDPDLALLLGDQLYALGLARLSALGDLEAISELADVISLVSQAHTAADAPLADAVWKAGAVAIGWGGSDAHDAAKRLARAEDRDALDALLAVAAPPEAS
jgi:hypothetical protein